MTVRYLAAWSIAGAALVAAAGFSVWLAILPEGTAAVAPLVPESEAAAFLDALAKPMTARPVIAVVGINDATETTDYLYPTGVLRRADIADVVMLSTEPGPVQLYPALSVVPDATTAQFDADHRDGADYVIVPAMSRDDDPVVMAWLKRQAAQGAVIIGVCAGAKVVAAAGLLEGKQATTHWYFRKDLLRRDPTIVHVADRRFVADGNVVTTTGISASMPMMLTLIEAIAGRDKATTMAAELGIDQWDARHASDAFKFTRGFATTVLTNTAAFWNHEDLGIALEPGMDELVLAMSADAWSRTYRSRVMSFSEGSAIETLGGIRVLPDRRLADWPDAGLVPVFPGLPVAGALDAILAAITSRYGEGTSEIVAMQLEYPGPAI